MRRTATPIATAVAMAVATAVAIAVASLAGCSPIPYDPENATVPYPRRLHTSEGVVDIQVFRDGETLTLVNATTTSYQDVKLWLNQRYVQQLASLPAGGRVEVSLSGFWDRWGGSPERGGLLRRFDPTPIRLAELQIDDAAPLVGLVVISAEEPKPLKTLQG